MCGGVVYIRRGKVLRKDISSLLILAALSVTLSSCGGGSGGAKHYSTVKVTAKGEANPELYAWDKNGNIEAIGARGGESLFNPDVSIISHGSMEDGSIQSAYDTADINCSFTVLEDGYDTQDITVNGG